MNAIEPMLYELFRNDFVYKMQASEKFGPISMSNFNRSDYIFFGGTNALTSNVNKEKYIGFSAINLIHFNRLSLLGVGWWQYQEKPNFYTKLFLNRMLDSSTLHSVRDSYTKKMLASIGIENVVNTCCPSTWALDEMHCSDIPKLKSDSVVMTITDYNQSPKEDAAFISQLQALYNKVFFWPQGRGDLSYFHSLNTPQQNEVFVLEPNLQSFVDLLSKNEIDYIGTRLHAGIKALQHKKRTLIIAIDNRSKEIANDINLIISERGDDKALDFFIKNSIDTPIQIPTSEIAKWKNQFHETSIDA